MPSLPLTRNQQTLAGAIEHILQQKGIVWKNTQDIKQAVSRFCYNTFAQYDYGWLIGPTRCVWKALAQTLPHICPPPWRMRHRPELWWTDRAQLRAFLQELSQNRSLSCPKDWARVPDGDILILGGSGLADYARGIVDRIQQRKTMLVSLATALRYKVSPKIRMVPQVRERSEAEERVGMIMRALLPTHTLILNDRRHHGLVFSQTNRAMELDLYFPKLRLGIEVQGRQHAQWVPHLHPTKDDFDRQQARDQEKRQACAKAGIVLVEVTDNIREHNSVFLAKAIQTALAEQRKNRKSLRPAGLARLCPQKPLACVL